MIERFDYNGVLHDTDYAEGTYVRYEDYLSALENINGDIVDKAYKLGYTDALASATKAIAEINTDGLDCD